MDIAFLSLFQVAVLHTCRYAMHTLLPNANDKNSAGRLGSLLQGLFCSIFLYMQRVQVSLLTTGLYFVYDLLASFYFNRPLPLLFQVHHAAGAVLCFLTLYVDGWKEDHSASAITLALLGMESTNPIFHSGMIVRAELPSLWENPWIRVPYSIAIVLSWSYLRIFRVAYGLQQSMVAYLLKQNDDDTQDITMVGLALGLFMLILQVQWLAAILNKKD